MAGIIQPDARAEQHLVSQRDTADVVESVDQPDEEGDEPGDGL